MIFGSRGEVTSSRFRSLELMECWNEEMVDMLGSSMSVWVHEILVVIDFWVFGGCVGGRGSEFLEGDGCRNDAGGDQFWA